MSFDIEMPLSTVVLKTVVLLSPVSLENVALSLAAEARPLSFAAGNASVGSKFVK